MSSSAESKFSSKNDDAELDAEQRYLDDNDYNYWSKNSDFLYNQQLSPYFQNNNNQLTLRQQLLQQQLNAGSGETASMGYTGLTGLRNGMLTGAPARLATAAGLTGLAKQKLLKQQRMALSQNR